MDNNWIPLTAIDQLDEAVEKSFQKPVVLFKHSVTCGISAGSNHHLESSWNQVEKDAEFYYLDLLAFRPISNEIASRFGVIHQSPQVLLLKNGEVTYHTSHHAININKIAEAISN